MATYKDYSVSRSIGRGSAYYTGVACSSAGSSASDLIDIRQFAWGCVFTSTDGTATLLTLCSAGSTADYANAAYDNVNVAITVTIAGGRAVQLPDAAFAFPYIAFTVDTTTDVSLFLKG
jgi:hypothetical protein